MSNLQGTVGGITDVFIDELDGLFDVVITGPSNGQTITYQNGIWVNTGAGGGSVTDVTATDPLSSTGGTTPDISLTGVVPIANGGTNNFSFTANRIIFSDGSGLYSADAVDYATSGTHVTIAAQANGDVPLATKGTASQSGNHYEARSSTGSVGARIDASRNFSRPGNSNSEQFGAGAVASGDNSAAFGVGATASGSYSTAIGRSTIASGGASFAAGLGNASGDGSVSIGNSSTATGSSCVAIGDHSNSSSGFSLGAYCVTTSGSVMAAGGNVQATNVSSVVFGSAGGSSYVNSTAGRFAQFSGNTNATAEFHLAGDSEYQTHQDMATFSATWATSTDASRKARARHLVYDTAAREYLRGEASGSAPMIGFLGASAVVRQSGLPEDGLVNLGLFSSVNPIVSRLSVTTSIDAKSTGTTTLYTVPGGKTAIITAAIVRCTAASAITVGPTLGIGVAAGEDDIYAATAITGLTTTAKIFGFGTIGMSVSVAAAGVIKVGIDAASTGTSQTIAIDLIGYLL